MNARDYEYIDLDMIYKMKYGFIHDSRKKVIADEILHTLGAITSDEMDRMTEHCDGNDYKALFRLVVAKMLDI